MITVPGGHYTAGAQPFYPEEGPPHERTVDTFLLDAHPVTNRMFSEFVSATGYVTTAERSGSGSMVFIGSSRPVPLDDWRRWWRLVPGAQWRHPEGPGTTLRTRADHPVVHVSHHDARAYAAWAGKRLPTEEEWEYAATRSHPGSFYAWGDHFIPEGQLMANTFHGQFPHTNDGALGWRGTSPVGSFPPDPQGFVDLIGNVWEWTTTPFTTSHPTTSCCTGDTTADSLVVKGGSHLCTPEYCFRFRPAARQPHHPDSSASHIGFRCAR